MVKSVKEIFRSYGVLDSDGRHINGTDKETNHHYGDIYESLFLNRTRVELMMEVGIADGSSLLAWRDIFPNALCVGLDIHHSDKAHGDRIEFYLGDQRSQVDCERAAAGRKFDLIVDDATHQLEDTLRTLFYLWPFVKVAGGMYVIEEFPNVGALRDNITKLWPFVEIVGDVEPLVILRKLP